MEQLERVKRELELAVQEHLRHDDAPNLEDQHSAQWYLLEAVSALAEAVEAIDARLIAAANYLEWKEHQKRVEKAGGKD